MNGSAIDAPAIVPRSIAAAIAAYGISTNFIVERSAPLPASHDFVATKATDEETVTVPIVAPLRSLAVAIGDERATQTNELLTPVYTEPGARMRNGIPCTTPLAI